MQACDVDSLNERLEKIKHCLGELDTTIGKLLNKRTFLIRRQRY